MTYVVHAAVHGMTTSGVRKKWRGRGGGQGSQKHFIFFPFCKNKPFKHDSSHPLNSILYIPSIQFCISPQFNFVYPLNSILYIPSIQFCISPPFNFVCNFDAATIYFLFFLCVKYVLLYSRKLDVIRVGAGEICDAPSRLDFARH